MLRSISLTSVLLATATAGAALPPQVQNAKDLDVMVEFVKQHPGVASTLRQIDMENDIVRYGDGCEARFGRQWRFRPPGWVGPAAPLVFKRSSCPVD
jgi:hypothetical protein